MSGRQFDGLNLHVIHHLWFWYCLGLVFELGFGLRLWFFLGIHIDLLGMLLFELVLLTDLFKTQFGHFTFVFAMAHGQGFVGHGEGWCGRHLAGGDGFGGILYLRLFSFLLEFIFELLPTTLG